MSNQKIETFEALVEHLLLGGRVKDRVGHVWRYSHEDGEYQYCDGEEWASYYRVLPSSSLSWGPFTVVKPCAGALTSEPIDTKAAERKARKERPVMRGLIDYAPDAMMGIANVSYVANEQHNPGMPMHWAYGKSMDHADCCVRHLMERGTIDTDDGLAHSAKAAWRAIMNYQTELERADPELHALRQAQRDLAAKGER